MSFNVFYLRGYVFHINILIYCDIPCILLFIALYFNKIHNIMVLSDLGKIIKRRRKELKITQPELARYAGVSINTISQIESGKFNPSFKTLNSILDVMGMNVEIKIKNLLIDK